MFHFSTQTYSDKKKREKKEEEKKMLKETGSYFQQPLIEQSLSTKNQIKRHIFRCISQEYPECEYLGSMNSFPSTVKMMHMLSDDHKKIIRRHFRMDVKNYLKRKYQKPGWLVPLESFECLRLVDKEGEAYTRTESLLIYKPFYLSSNLKMLLDRNPQYVKNLNLYKIHLQLIKCCIEFCGLDNFMMSTSNVYLEDDLETLQINHTSVTGLPAIFSKSEIERHQFYEIQPHITNQVSFDHKIGIKTKMRSFLVNSLSLITEFDIYNQNQQNLNAGIIGDQIIKATAKESREFLKSYIQGADNKSLIKKFSKKFGEELKGKKILSLYHKILTNEENVEEKPLKWEEIIQFFSYIPVHPNQQLEEAFKELHKFAWSEETDKKLYEERGLSGQKLYIPIKYQGLLVEFFKYHSWWEIFFEKDKESMEKIRAKKKQRRKKIKEKNKKLKKEDEEEDDDDDSEDEEDYNFMLEPFCYTLLNLKIRQYEGIEDKNFIDDVIVIAVMRYLMGSNMPVEMPVSEGSQKDKEASSEKTNQFILISERFRNFNEYHKLTKIDKTRKE